MHESVFPSFDYLLMNPRFNFEKEISQMMDNLWDCDGCAPPAFNLPPPPRPDWLEDLDGCEKSDIELLETCDNTIIIDANFEDAFHSVSIIVVCSLILVIMLMVVSVVLFRRRKNNGLIDSNSDFDCHQIDHQHRHQVMNHENDTTRKQLTTALSSLKRGSVRSSVNSNGTFNLDSHFPNSTSLPNHYIQENEKRIRTLDPRIRQDFNDRFRPPPGPRRKVMQLSDAPPHFDEDNRDYPHILIGGQPFYLIPSKPSYETEYAYASNYQSSSSSNNVPIYEEIDVDHCDTYSDRGEVGSVHEIIHPLPLANKPVSRLASDSRSSSNSVYYYSDTLRPRQPPRISDDSDSGISNRSMGTPKETTLVLQNHNSTRPPTNV